MNYSVFDELTKNQSLINEKRPFEGYALNQLKDYYKFETTWSSNALEGNSIALSETQMIIEKGITIHGHTIKEINECTGHADAYDYMTTLIHQNKITQENIKTLHKLFANNIKDIPCPGEYRNVSKTYVQITGSDYDCPDYEKVPDLMNEFIEWLDDNKTNYHPVEYAAEAHRRLIYIHPFPDGNGRITRLITNAILLQNQYLPISIKPNEREEYISFLENGRLEPSKFTLFIAKQELKEQERMMKVLHIQNKFTQGVNYEPTTKQR